VPLPGSSWCLEKVGLHAHCPPFFLTPLVLLSASGTATYEMVPVRGVLVTSLGQWPFASFPYCNDEEDASISSMIHPNSISRNSNKPYKINTTWKVKFQVVRWGLYIISINYPSIVLMLIKNQRRMFELSPRYKILGMQSFLRLWVLIDGIKLREGLKFTPKVALFGARKLDKEEWNKNVYFPFLYRWHFLKLKNRRIIF
jgi:hypothetical protein